MIRLIVSDLDGTLLKEDAVSPSPLLFEEIGKLRSRGIFFCVASGRSYSSLRSLFAPIADDMFFIADDGALTLQGDKPLSPTPISEGILSQAAALIDKAGEGCVLSHLYYEGLYALSHKKQSILRESFGGQVRTVDDMSDLSGVYKLGLFRTDPKLSEQIGLLSGLRTSYEDENWLEFSPAGCDKGSALLRLMRHLGISKAQVMAFGDNYNDFSMLQNAGIAYRMKGSRYDLSAITKNSTNSVEETLRCFFRL